ncbi:anti-sigma K factor RskA [Arthrobacter globiformis NBRC 12137]|uniref:Regulator of SigK n=1 Tax=Arthrobacter globiformis (strain ATCC 8010 / DSM 20124 / JCM 1332 / NBRC 12137 / NCIMB 8907 / NRRL B-2979 / 168) TaxID=1077972 RepID=H0QRY8_ARTG1|nr:anti-sigma factor [Arthrobacter globiformis]GAB15474.1 anti-sigma K factor RskA [Arthrobacter globiformis NBRC 12137]
MTDTNDSRGRQLPRAFAADIPTDLAAGRAVELAEIYALDAISDAEREAIDTYVGGAPEAERASFNERVRQARETLAMSFTAEEEPPADLFARIVAQLPEQPARAQAPRREAAAEGPAAPAAVPTAEPAPAGDELSAARQRRDVRRRPAGLRNWLIGVAAAAVIALGGVGIGAYVANQNDPFNQVIEAQDARQATVDVNGGGTATVSISPSHDALVVRMKDVPPPPAGKVYQMWLIPKDGSTPVSQGLMDAEALSKPALVKGIGSAAALGITVEPAGGSATPTLPTVAAAPLNT